MGPTQSNDCNESRRGAIVYKQAYSNLVGVAGRALACLWHSAICAKMACERLPSIAVSGNSRAPLARQSHPVNDIFGLGRHADVLKRGTIAAMIGTRLIGGASVVGIGVTGPRKVELARQQRTFANHHERRLSERF